jgi:hypothetical protein
MRSLPDDQITRYLLRTLQASEADAFEERLMDDRGLFAETQDRENDLVDLYVFGRLSGDALAAFERSLIDDPSRQEKVANARSLAEHIETTRLTQSEAVPNTKETTRFFGWFNAPRLAFGSLLIILAAISTMLFLENRRVSNELARLEAANADRPEPSQPDIQQTIDAERSVTAELTRDLDRERERSSRLEREINALRSTNTRIPTPEPRQEIIRSVILRPDRTEREISSTSAAAGPKRTSVLIALPAGTPADLRVSIKLNGRTIKQNIAAVTDPAGTAAVSVTIADTELSLGENVLSVHDDTGGELTRYVLKVSP